MRRMQGNRSEVYIKRGVLRGEGGDSQTADLGRLAEQFRDLEPDFEHKMRVYLAKSKRLFEDTFDIVIRNNFDNIFDYLSALIRVNPRHPGGSIGNEMLHQLIRFNPAHIYGCE